ncbi:endolytic transglycosylase MltG [Trichothermofontia sp.]
MTDQQPNGSHRRSRWLFYGLILPTIIGVGLWQGWRWWAWASQPVLATASLGMNAEPPTVRIRIEPGTPAQQIGADLAAANLIRSAMAWSFWTHWQTLRATLTGNPIRSFQAGTYELSPTQSLPAIAEQILLGQTVARRLTIPEGWSLQQMADYFAEQGLFSRQAFLEVTQQDWSDPYPWLPEGLPHLEGFLFPDTYEIAAEAVTPEQIVQMMLDHFEAVALPLYQQAQQRTPSPELSLKDWVTLASIVEKEAVLPAERPLIAGVFTARLRRGQRLEADPTVEYGLGIQQTPDQPLTLAEVRTPSPYNTYLNEGLPPTPIASPGLASLKAVLEPQDTDYLYFVARYDGSHVFSRTLAEHEAAQAKIREEQEARQQATP